MGKFIEVTTTSKDKVLINTDIIGIVERKYPTEGIGTVMRLTIESPHNDLIYINETYEQIREMLEQ